MRERAGVAFRFTALVAAAPGFEEMAVYVQDQLRRVGVQMDLQTLEGSVIRERIKDLKFETAFTGYRNEAWALQRWFGKDSPIRYRNARVTELIDRALVTAAHTMDQIYSELMQIFREEIPVTFLHPRVETIFAHRRVRGLSTPFRAEPLRNMENLWLEEKE